MCTSDDKANIAIGKVYTSLGLYENAGDMLEDAVAMGTGLQQSPARFAVPPCTPLETSPRRKS
jgi:hypothetical protein